MSPAVFYGLFVLCGLGVAYLGSAIYARKSQAGRIAAASRTIVQAPTLLSAEAAAAPPSPAAGAQILQSAQVENADLGLLAKLPPFAPVAIHLLRILDRPDVEPRDVASQIAADPALRAQLLAIANSPLFGLRVTVQDPLDRKSVV